MTTKAMGALLGVLAASALHGSVGAQELQTAVANDVSDVQAKILSLAEAIPKAQYGWRPAEGVRSVGEVLMHLAAGNYVILERIGADSDAGTGPGGRRLDDPGVVTDPDDIAEAVEESFRFAVEVVRTTPSEGLWGQAARAGQGTTLASQILLVQTHAHEHLGQLIAYARTIGVAPPWSR
jgi:uncharacterized damage-inducible protein DinB